MKHLGDTAKASLGVLLLVCGVEDDRDGVDDTVVGSDIDGVGGASAEVVNLADDGIIHEGLAEFALVDKLLASEGLDGAGDGAGGDLERISQLENARV